MKRSWRRNWIVLTATIVHLVWGCMLLFSDAPLHTTPLGMLHGRANPVGTGVVYLSASGFALLTILRPKLDTTFTGLLLSIPQQFLLMISCWTAMVAIYLGRYPDGYVPTQEHPRLFILADQLWPILGMWFHTLSLIDWYWWSRKT